MDYGQTTELTPEQATGMLAVSGIYTIVMIAFAILMIAALWKIFTKAGKPGWAAIVPIYNIIVLFEVIGRPAWWLVLLLIPFVNIVIGWIMAFDLAKSFGKGGGYALGLIVFPYIFYPMLGFGSAAYVGPSAAVAAPQPYYPPQQGGYVPPQQGAYYPPQQPPQAPYPPQQPPQAPGGYPPQQPPQAPYPPQQPPQAPGGYPPPPPPQAPYPPQQPPQAPGGYPPPPPPQAPTSGV